jgi:uncharacterized protein YbjT (DUF2867 family)
VDSRLLAIPVCCLNGFTVQHAFDSTTDINLILGGTSKTGRRIAGRLRASGCLVRVGSRSGEPPFDWEERSTSEPALRDVTAAYVSFFPDLAVAGAPEAVAELADSAIASGTRRLVLPSGRGEEEAQRAEQALQASGATSTISWFIQNFSERFLRDSIVLGQVSLPVGDVPEPFVDAEDIADVAAAALTEDGHGCEVYELTGLMTFAQAVGEIVEAIERPVPFTEVSIDEYARALRGEGCQRTPSR